MSFGGRGASWSPKPGGRARCGPLRLPPRQPQPPPGSSGACLPGAAVSGLTGPTPTHRSLGNVCGREPSPTGPCVQASGRGQACGAEPEAWESHSPAYRPVKGRHWPPGFCGSDDSAGPLGILPGSGPMPSLPCLRTPRPLPASMPPAGRCPHQEPWGRKEMSHHPPWGTEARSGEAARHQLPA